MDLASLLKPFLDGLQSGTPAAGQPDAADHYDRVAQQAPADMLRDGLSAMFRSDRTPAFGQMAGQMYGQASPNQQAGMLNQILSTLGPAALASLAGALGSGALANVLKGGQGTGAPAAVPQVSPEVAAKVSPEDVRVLAERAEQQEPSLIDRMSQFYAEHPTLVKTVGGAALSIALAKMAERQRQG